MSGIDAFINAINAHEFVEAHELLEDEWNQFKKEGKKAEAKAVQGLINGATALALYHIKKRPAAYEKIWKVYEKYKDLLDSVTVENIEKYKEAAKLLEKKQQELVKQS